MDSKNITVTVELPVKYKAVMNGMNVLILEATIAETYYDVKVLPEDVRAAILNAITEHVRIEDYERRFNREIEDPFAVPAGLTD